MTLFELTRNLINIPSLTGDEFAVAQFLTSYLNQLGYQVETQEVERNRFNVIATTKAPARIVFSTHLDTVPPLIPASEDEVNIHGRGSCDAKGIIAAQIFAAERLRSEGFQEVGLLLTVDEELSSKGAQLANHHPLASQCRYLINGEPTDNKLAIGTKGSMRFIIRTQGTPAHSAYPEVGDSAIEKLLDVLNDLRSVDWPTDSFFGETTCNIGVINAGTRPNVIPAAATAELQVRVTVSVDEAKKIVDQTVAGRASVEYASAHDPVKLFYVRGFEETIVRFTTDIPYLSNWGQAVLLGPGSILDAHTDHERISKRELEKAVDLYVKLGQRLLKES
jgi:acetylornithine deacetylase